MKDHHKSRSRGLSEKEFQELYLYVNAGANLARSKGAVRAIVDELIVLLLLDAGLRPKELCNLNMDDFSVTDGERSLCIRDNTGKPTRKVDIPLNLAQSLQRFVRLYRKGAKPSDPLLMNERRNRFGYISIYSKVRRIGQESGIGRLCPGVLRNSYIIRLYEKEQDLRLVQEQAGHASPRTTAKYAQSSAHFCPETQIIHHADASVSIPNEETEKGNKERVICEGCDKPTSLRKARRIESGQMLCQNCIEFFRSG